MYHDIYQINIKEKRLSKRTSGSYKVIVFFLKKRTQCYNFIYRSIHVFQRVENTQGREKCQVQHGGDLWRVMCQGGEHRTSHYKPFLFFLIEIPDTNVRKSWRASVWYLFVYPKHFLQIESIL